MKLYCQRLLQNCEHYYKLVLLYLHDETRWTQEDLWFWQHDLWLSTPFDLEDNFASVALLRFLSVATATEFSDMIAMTPRLLLTLFLSFLCKCEEHADNNFLDLSFLLSFLTQLRARQEVNFEKEESPNVSRLEQSFLWGNERKEKNGKTFWTYVPKFLIWNCFFFMKVASKKTSSFAITPIRCKPILFPENADISPLVQSSIFAFLTLFVNFVHVLLFPSVCFFNPILKSLFVLSAM